MPSSFRLRSMTSASFDLPILARCERPTAAFFRASRLQPGCLAHGPEEKHGFFGVWVGFMGENLMIANRGGANVRVSFPRAFPRGPPRVHRSSAFAAPA